MHQDSEYISELTDQELLITNIAKVDVGAGYPYLALPDWVWECITDASALHTVYGFPPDVTGHESGELTEGLLLAVCDLLAINPAHHRNAFATFAGSVALDRVISTVAPQGAHVVSASPSIDIIPGMLSERAISATFVPSADGFDLDVEALLDAVTPATECIILTSPENPTGNVIEAEDLRLIAEFSRDRGITLVVDQCFALIDPFRVGISLLPNVAVEGLSWVFLWDTGKTFGLNEDKLGFIVCSPDLRDRLAHRLNILQFDVSRRLKVLFREILRRAKSAGYPNYLSERVRANVEIAEAVLVGTGLQPLIPDAGSFLLLDTVGHRASASELAAALLQTKSLGVIRIDSFFTPQPPALHADRYIRLAMAREPSVIEEAARRIAYIAR